MFISKGMGEPRPPSFCRTLGLLDTAEKGLEKMLLHRLLKAIYVAGDLSPWQCDFRRGRSTINAEQESARAINRAQMGNNLSFLLLLNEEFIQFG